MRFYVCIQIKQIPICSLPPKNSALFALVTAAEKYLGLKKKGAEAP